MNRNNHNDGRFPHDNHNGGWGSPWNQTVDQGDAWLVPAYQLRAVEMMIRQVLRQKADTDCDGIVDVIGSFVGGRLRGRAQREWVLGGGWIRNADMEE